MAEETTSINISGVPITLIPQIDAAAAATHRKRSAFIVHEMTKIVNRRKKKPVAGGNAHGGDR